MDILSMVYNTLIADPLIQDRAAGRIKYYEYPETEALGEGVHVIIDPLDVPVPRIFGDNRYLTYDILIQVETWSKTRNQTKEVADRIEAILWDNGFLQVGGIDEYDENVFRDARRYRKKIYRDEVI